ncbi:hypothetical protein L7F22_010112 [Adiantum nelumboides]|nr:hypothetical protein [Adiantum nelumboides]
MAGTQNHSHGALLMRYHSAPSSVLASLLHSEDVVCNTAPHLEDSELARICMPTSRSIMQIAAENAHGRIRAYDRHAPQSLFSTIPLAPVSAGISFAHQCADSNESPTSGHLCSIFKRTQIDPRANVQPPLQNIENFTTSEHSTNSAIPAGLSNLSQPSLSTKSNLIRHSSFPAEILSRLGAQDSNEGPMQQFTGPCVHHDSVRVSTAAESIHYGKARLTHGESDILTDNKKAAHIVHDMSRDAHLNTSSIRFAHKGTEGLESNRPHLANGSSFNGKSTISRAQAKTKVSNGETPSRESSLCVNQSSLFRHSSLPASLLSQLSGDGPCERVSMPSSSGNSSEEGGSRYTSRVSGFWDDAGPGAVPPGQRKRGREVQYKAADRLCAQESIKRCSVEEEILQWNFGPQSDSNSGDLLSLDDSVLCRVRAKRGCATHPRSIAERVRRTKISEGMRKLQELVPNLEKQTNTASMLDEAVEYVKFLQQQIQKLTESQAKCKGMCHSKTNT